MIKNKIFKILMVITVLIMQILVIGTKANAANIGESKSLERGELGYYCIQKWNGSRWIYLTYNQTFYTDTDGQKYIAYCLSPGLPGVGYVSGEKETYNVKISEMLNNDMIWRVLKNGYPNKTIEDLGVETADDAYFATMQAINSILRGYTLEQARGLYCVGQFAINGESLEDVQRRGNKTLNALLNLINIGLNGTETRDQLLKVSIEKTAEFKEENNDYYSQTFKIVSATEVSKYNIEKLENLPAGSYVADLQGNKKQIFNGGEEFKIMISKKSEDDEIKGNISVKALQKNYPVYYGTSEIEGCQDYALCNNSYAEVSLNTEVYAQVNKSKVTIIKTDVENNNPLKGVKFQVTYTDGTSNTYLTDENGKIVIANLRPGTVKIKEVKPLEKYKLNNEEYDVKVGYNEAKEVEIKNEKQKGNIKVIKVDKDNKEIKIANVKFQLKDEENNIIKEGVTDENGELLFVDLVIGKYNLVEVETGEEYILSNKDIEVEVIVDKTQEVKIENEKMKIPQEEKNEVVEQRKLPKTGENNSKYILISNIILVSFYNIILVLKKFKNNK